MQPAEPGLGSLGLSTQPCGVSPCSAASQTEPDSSSRSYLVNFKEILVVRSTTTRSKVMFGKDSVNPKCSLSVKTPLAGASVERGSGNLISISAALLDQSQWQMVCPEYDSGWNPF